MIALIDYGAGNLTSVRKALAAVGAQVAIPGSPAEIASAEAVIVPGVGNFQRTDALDHATAHRMSSRAASACSV